MDTVRHIPVDDILYFETGGKSHRIILHGIKGNIDFTGSIRNYRKVWEKQFLRVHRAYLANVRHIRNWMSETKKSSLQTGRNVSFHVK